MISELMKVYLFHFNKRDSPSICTFISLINDVPVSFKISIVVNPSLVYYVLNYLNYTYRVVMRKIYLLLPIALLFNFATILCKSLHDKLLIEYPENHLQEIKIIIDCVYNITTKYSAGRNIIFLAEQINTDLSESLVREIDRGLKVITSIENVSKNIGFFLFLQDNRETSYINILEKIPPNNLMRFVVIFDFQEKIDFRHIQKIFEEFWLFQIIDVIALVPFKISRNIRVYTYYPFSSTRCGETGPPMLINVWNSLVKAFLNQHNLFSRLKKVFNLHGCPLNCVGIHRPPESTITQLSINSWQLSGTGNKVFKFIEKYMNFTAKIALFQKMDQVNNHKLQNGTPNYSNYDIAFGKFIRVLDSEPNFDFITENRMDCFTWAVPHGIGRQPSIWTNYVIEFSAITWLMILFNIILSSIVIRWIVYRLNVKHPDWRTYRFILFYTFSTFIGATLKLKSNSSVLRIFTSQWLLYSMVITAAYQAYMGSLMTIPSAEPEINRQLDLLNTRLNLVGRQEMFHVLNESATSAEFSNLLQRFFILPPTDFDVIIKRVIEQRDIAVFTSKRELIYYAQRRRNNLGEKHQIHIFSNCVFKSYASAFKLRKGSPFQHPIRSLLMRLFETGIYNNWDTDNVRDEIYHNIIFSKETILILRELYGAFVVLFSGLGLSTIIFIMEMFVKLIKDKPKLNTFDVSAILKNQRW